MSDTETQVTRGDYPRMEGDHWVFEKKKQNSYTQRTIDLMRMYQADLTRAYNGVRVCRDAPSLPKSIWETVFESHYVNFELINAYISRRGEAEGPTVTIGDHTIRVNYWNTKEPVTDFLHWHSCWIEYKSAVCLAFPHRAKELSDYEARIRRLFELHSHSRVIEYDANIRWYVAQEIRRRLTSTFLHTLFRGTLLNPNEPTAPAPTSNTTESNSLTSHEVCRRWNYGTCHRPQSLCNYQHLCIHCGEEHQAILCPN
jgi:hypothetical protein